GENNLIDIMKKVSSEVELSSLPKIIGDKRVVVLSLMSKDEKLVKENFSMFTKYLNEKEIHYELKDFD
ncbi:MAG: competence/damage-inducible protein A, partial [Arcobacter sp.]